MSTKIGWMLGAVAIVRMFTPGALLAKRASRCYLQHFTALPDSSSRGAAPRGAAC
jgi:hypothetical protein